MVSVALGGHRESPRGWKVGTEGITMKTLPGGATTWGSWWGDGTYSPKGNSTCSVGHLHTLLNLAVLFVAQACDLPRQHASVRPDELTEQQNILEETENRSEGHLSGLLMLGSQAT